MTTDRAATFPHVSIGDGIVAISIRAPVAGPSHGFEVPVILDFDLLGALVGIEIIGIRDSVGVKEASMLKSALSGLPKAISSSYDEKADAFYLAVSGERSGDQRAADGTFIFEPDGGLLAIFARW